MTSDEKLINDTWPLIRETVLRFRPLLEEGGLAWVVQSRPLEEQIGFWLALRRMVSERMPEVELVAREAKNRLI